LTDGKNENIPKIMVKLINSTIQNNKVYFDLLFFDIAVKRFFYFLDIQSTELEASK
jgi:hypothetical protein